MFHPFAIKSDADAGYSGERARNVFVRQTQQGISPAVLVGRAGTERLIDLGVPVQALTAVNEDVLAVCDGQLRDVATGDILATFGVDAETRVATSGPAAMIVENGIAHVWDGAKWHADVDKGAIDYATDVEYFGGYFVLVGEGMGRRDIIQVSALSGWTFDALDFASAEVSSDRLLAVVADHNELVFFGDYTIEVWYQSGDPAFPFARDRIVERGIGMSRALAKEDNAIFFEANNGKIMAHRGAEPEIISTAIVEENPEPVTSIFVVEDRGSTIVCVRRASGPTDCYDLRTRIWHERTTGLSDDPWYVTCAGLWKEDWYYGTSTGLIVRPGGYEEDGQPILAEAISPPLVRRGGLFNPGPGRPAHTDNR